MEEKISYHLTDKTADFPLSARNRRILTLLKLQGRMTLKEILDNFPTLSPKTVQIELRYLENLGLVKKVE